jgi:hypothetical protein
MACGCNKGRQAATGDASVSSGTYRVMVSGRQVYESSSKTAADTVAARFQDATILAPGQEA